MSAPVSVSRPFARTTIKDEDPVVEIHRNCVYVPIVEPVNFWDNPFWGVYASDGRNITAARFYRKSHLGPEGQSDTCAIDTRNLEYAPLDRYFYVGNMINHFGHFLCSSMARLWALSEFEADRPPLIGHAAGQPSDWFQWHHTGPMLASAGVGEADFASFTKPVRIRELVVARPSFIEENLAHAAFATAAHRWGDRLVSGQDTSAMAEVVYLSKTRLGPLASGLSNEAPLEEEMRSLGVPVVYPETLTLAEQVALFRTTKRILGQTGSAFHTSVFSEPKRDQVLVQINQHPTLVSTNHALFDAVNRNRAYYLYFDGWWQDRPGTLPGFVLRRPKLAARELLQFAYDVSG